MGTNLKQVEGIIPQSKVRVVPPPLPVAPFCVCSILFTLGLSYSKKEWFKMPFSMDWCLSDGAMNQEDSIENFTSAKNSAGTLGQDTHSQPQLLPSAIWGIIVLIDSTGLLYRLLRECM